MNRRRRMTLLGPNDSMRGRWAPGRGHRSLVAPGLFGAGAQPENKPLPRLQSGMMLEAAAKELTNSSYDAAIVIDSSGRPLGVVSLRQITAALSSARRSEMIGVPATTAH